MHWGKSWTLVTCNFTVPSYIEADGWNLAYAAGQHVTPRFFIPWCQIWCHPDYPYNAHSAWFSGFKLYVNQHIVSTLTPNPSSTPISIPESLNEPIQPHPETTNVAAPSVPSIIHSSAPSNTGLFMIVFGSSLTPTSAIGLIAANPRMFGRLKWLNKISRLLKKLIGK